jgi:uncharacterized protein YecE (DUF72 family)
MRVHVGTSGYNYPEWRGTFYPPKHPAKEMFAFYASRFQTVEINYTFYRMPTAATTAAWRAQAPDGFQYTLKAPQRISHVRRLKDAGEDLARFCESARVLGPHLGGVLVQLPPTLKADPARLEGFLAAMPADVRSSFEFRHDSWLQDDVYALLADRQAALVVADFGTRATPVRPTARHGYFRLRDEGYTAADLERWADRLVDAGSGWEDVFVYFKHEDAGKGPEFARAFVDILARRGISAR